MAFGQACVTVFHANNITMFVVQREERKNKEEVTGGRFILVRTQSVHSTIICPLKHHISLLLPLFKINNSEERYTEL